VEDGRPNGGDFARDLVENNFGFDAMPQFSTENRI